jgi:hypothetical protein
MDGFATAISFTLQYGVPLKVLVDKFSHVRFEPSGWTGNQHVPYAKSMVDYIFRWMGIQFLGPEYAVSEVGETMTLRPTETSPQQDLPFNAMTTDARCAPVRLHNDATEAVTSAATAAATAAARFSFSGVQWENRNAPGRQVSSGSFFN